MSTPAALSADLNLDTVWAVGTRVVDVLAVDEQLDHRNSTGICFHQHQQRILQLFGGKRASPRKDDRDGRDLLAEQPAHAVDLMDKRVGQNHLGCEGRGHADVPVAAVQEECFADVPLVQCRLDLAIAGVVPAHEADLNRAAAIRDLRLHDLEAVVTCGGRRPPRRSPSSSPH
jgi:hypothetical protein